MSGITRPVDGGSVVGVISDRSPLVCCRRSANIYTLSTGSPHQSVCVPVCANCAPVLGDHKKSRDSSASAAERIETTKVTVSSEDCLPAEGVIEESLWATAASVLHIVCTKASDCDGEGDLSSEDCLPAEGVIEESLWATAASVLHIVCTKASDCDGGFCMVSRRRLVK
ncbi:hypothetical protein J6590_029432 [Homalodisca vitripennis]|nr:hypothetical protein J6590_029432 [Homalodisca vitripennis]